MTKEPTVEQRKKFWEWCGFKQGEVFWTAPDEEEGAELHGEPDIDINNLRRYPLEKVIELGYYPSMVFVEYERVWRVELYHPATKVKVVPEIVEWKDKELEAALFWAIWQVMESVYS